MAYFQDNVNRICSTCSPFLTTRPEGSRCCGSNCANCTVNGYCAVCQSGFTISGGYCHQSGYTSRENYNYGLIKELLCHQPGEKSTMQTITALMGPDLTESDEATIYWMLFAKDIASDFETLTCDAIELLVSEDMNQEQLTGIFFNGKGRVAYSDSLYALVFSMDFQGLRANTKYNFTLCVKAATYANSTWSQSSVDFRTKDNGNSILKYTVELTASLDVSETTDFICELINYLQLNETNIRAATGESCTTSRRILTSEFSVNKQERVLDALNSLELVFYGNAYTEDTDTTATQIASMFQPGGGIDGFLYQSASGNTIGITKGTYSGIVTQTPPFLSSQNFSTTFVNDKVMISGLTYSGNDGYLYILLVPTFLNYTLINTRMTILQKNLVFRNGVNYSADGTIVYRRSFRSGIPTLVTINGIQPNISYNVSAFATNQDTSEYAVGTPTNILTFIVSKLFPGILNVTSEGKIGVFLISELVAAILLFIVWMLLFNGRSRIVKLFRKQKAKKGASFRSESKQQTKCGDDSCKVEDLEIDPSSPKVRIATASPRHNF